MIKPTSTNVDAASVERNLARTDEGLEIQGSACLADAYAHYPNRCRSCLAKVNDCCFMSLRAFKNVRGGLRYGPYFLNTTLPDGLASRRGQSFRSPQRVHRQYVLNRIKDSLKMILAEDAAVLRESGAIARRRPHYDNDRHNCDGCLTSLFNLHWMCSVCGLDICTDCFRKDWTVQSNRHLGKCTHRRVHVKRHMLPVVKYNVLSMDEILSQCTTMIDTEERPEFKTTDRCVVMTKALPTLSPSANQTQLKYESSWPMMVANYSNDQPHDFCSATDRKQAGNPSDDIFTISANDITLKIFQEQWNHGKPIFVRDVLQNSKADWSPSYFTKHYGEHIIDAIDCGNGDIEEMSVKSFFDGFQYPKNRGCDRRKILKIKDWPPKTDFENQFPVLHDDFMGMLPVPEYSTKTGYFNLSNRLPPEYVRPDLGPKMFIAYGCNHSDGNVGTTKLHCDMADAVNVMCYAEKTDEKPAAVWDIFRYDDLYTIRMFVAKIALERNLLVVDPIHSQWIYLNDELRERLFAEYGVKSWRIYQDPGDAVYIPAGCAHQVSNYHSAIKCAFDFLSPENLSRCLDMTSQFSLIGREDVLQLKNTILFAWKSVFADISTD